MAAHLRALAVLGAITLLVAIALGSADAEQTVPVSLLDDPFSVVANPLVVSEGSVTFDVTNSGPFLPHNLVIVDTDLPADSLPVINNPQSPQNGFVDESQLNVVARTQEFTPGGFESLQVNLPAGNYVLICNNAANHYTAGMYVGFQVLPPPPTATPKDPGGDTDGDTIPNSKDPNDDNDACTDVQELGDDPTLGGLRNPHNFWDFFDVPAGAALTRDGNVTGQDIFALLSRFNATDAGPGDFDRYSDPFSTPNPAAAGQPRANYHPAYDRGPLVGPHVWDLGPPDGAITGTEIFAIIAQFGHSCA